VLLVDERVLADTDTLMVFGLDYLVSEQEAEQGEIDAIWEWLNREGTCLLLAPHHDVGFTSDTKQRQMEYKHHGDELVPRQQPRPGAGQGLGDGETHGRDVHSRLGQPPRS
jgi:hypothetical protein